MIASMRPLSIFLIRPSLFQLIEGKFSKGRFGASHCPSEHLLKFLSKKSLLLSELNTKRGVQEPGVKRRVFQSLSFQQGWGRPGSPCL